MAYPKVYESGETLFTHNGLAVLHECISCEITEELNGGYELELVYPLDDRGKWLNLDKNNIIIAAGQMFRIYRKTKDLESVKVNARHIFYDLLDNFIEGITLTGANGAAAVNSILSNTQYAHDFTSTGDGTTVGDMEFKRINPVEAIMGQEGVIEKVGGELERINYVIHLHQAMGSDRGVLVSYGKNIIGIEEELDISGLCTRIMPIGKDELLLTQKYVDSDYIENYPHPKVRAIDFNDIDNEAGLMAAAENYFAKTLCDIPIANYRIDFIELTKTEEYKNYAVLESVSLADTVTVRHTKLNIDLQLKVIKVVKDILTARIIEIELGKKRENLASSINNSIQAVNGKITEVKSAYQIAIENATNLITGETGGFVKIICDETTGEPEAIAIMDTDDIATAQKVWLWNNSGLGYSSTGIAGPYDTAITSDGSIVATFITTGTLSANLIKAGWNGINSNVVIDSTGLTIKNGKILLENSNGDDIMYVDTSGLVVSDRGFCAYDQANGGGTQYVGHIIYNIPPAGSPYYPLYLESDGEVFVKSATTLAQGGQFQDVCCSGLQMDSERWGTLGQSFIRAVNYEPFIVIFYSQYNDSLMSIKANEAFFQKLTVYGSKQRAVASSSGYVGMNAYETTTPFFGDIGSGRIIDGECVVSIDPVFAEIVNTNIEYHVFLTKYGDGDVYVSERNASGFVVNGTEGIEFGWELKAKQKGYENERLTIQDNMTNDYPSEINQFVDQELNTV